MMSAEFTNVDGYGLRTPQEVDLNHDPRCLSVHSVIQDSRAPACLMTPDSLSGLQTKALIDRFFFSCL